MIELEAMEGEIVTDGVVEAIGMTEEVSEVAGDVEVGTDEESVGEDVSDGEAVIEEEIESNCERKEQSPFSRTNETDEFKNSLGGAEKEGVKD